jgi:hypothetical protein
MGLIQVIVDELLATMGQQWIAKAFAGDTIRPSRPQSKP